MPEDRDRYLLEKLGLDEWPAWCEYDPAPSDEVWTIIIMDEDGYQTHMRGTLVWVPTAGRAGIATNSTPDWTDADSPSDALDRWVAGEMV